VQKLVIKGVVEYGERRARKVKEAVDSLPNKSHFKN